MLRIYSDAVLLRAFADASIASRESLRNSANLRTKKQFVDLIAESVSASCQVLWNMSDMLDTTEWNGATAFAVSDSPATSVGASCLVQIANVLIDQ